MNFNMMRDDLVIYRSDAIGTDNTGCAIVNAGQVFNFDAINASLAPEEASFLETLSADEWTEVPEELLDYTTSQNFIIYLALLGGKIEDELYNRSSTCNSSIEDADPAESREKQAGRKEYTMRYTNKQKADEWEYTAALCKTFSGDADINAAGKKYYHVHGCLYLYKNTHEIAVEVFKGCDPEIESLIPFILADKDVQEMVRGYYQHGRRDLYSMRYSTGMSGREDIFINFPSKTGQGVITGGKHLMHVSCYDKVCEIKKMYIGDFVECIHTLMEHGHDFSKKSDYVYTKPYFAFDATTDVHRIL